ncbi:hypothetical protein [Gordonia sp. (in: high G+C Gram-positive bacteria)]|uniref:hypothetical protein n=1 Tax=Gordonia sp. (in: high G+C Gram-positive bacteria) TaxID=84139 RepID=UPI0039E657B2
MSTPTPSGGGSGSVSPGVWKAIAVIGIALVALIVLEPVIKGLIWIGILALAVYGGLMLLSGGKSGSKK